MLLFYNQAEGSCVVTFICHVFFRLSVDFHCVFAWVEILVGGFNSETLKDLVVVCNPVCDETGIV